MCAIGNRVFGEYNSSLQGLCSSINVQPLDWKLPWNPFMISVVSSFLGKQPEKWARSHLGNHFFIFWRQHDPLANGHFWLGYQIGSILFLPHYSQANIEMVTRYFARFLTRAIENWSPLRPFWRYRTSEMGVCFSCAKKKCHTKNKKGTISFGLEMPVLLSAPKVA